MPPITVLVSRPSKWGNPFRIKDSRQNAVDAFKTWIDGSLPGQELKEAARSELRGKNLACWCPLDGPCHADVLLEIANTPRKVRLRPSKMRKPSWADLRDAMRLSKFSERHKFGDEKDLAYRLAEAVWGYLHRVESATSRPTRQQQKHFLRILKNRATREDLHKWRSEMTFDDAINLGVAGLTGLDAEKDTTALREFAEKACKRLLGDVGGAPRDYARDFWFRSLIVIYELGTGKRAAASVCITSKRSEQPGPFLRFATDACSIAKIEFDPLAEQSKLKRLIKEVRGIRDKNRWAFLIDKKSEEHQK